MRKKISFYGIVATTSTIIRQFYLPNPFDCFGVYADLINLITEGPLHALTFALVGLVYTRGSFPAWGSFLYLITYSGIVGILHLCGIHSFALWWIAFLMILAIGIILVIRWLIYKLFPWIDEI